MLTPVSFSRSLLFAVTDALNEQAEDTIFASLAIFIFYTYSPGVSFVVVTLTCGQVLQFVLNISSSERCPPALALSLDRYPCRMQMSAFDGVLRFCVGPHTLR